MTFAATGLVTYLARIVVNQVLSLGSTDTLVHPEHRRVCVPWNSPPSWYQGIFPFR